MFAKENQPTLCADITALLERVREVERTVARHENPQHVAQVQRVQA